MRSAQSADDYVLVVDDNPEALELLELMLRSSTLEVVGVDSVEKALDTIASRGAPKVVVTDLVMPGLNGKDLVNHLRGDAILGTVPVIVVTAVTEGRLVLAVDAVLTKPVDEALLVALVRRLAGVDSDRR